MTQNYNLTTLFLISPTLIPMIVIQLRFICLLAYDAKLQSDDTG